MLSEHILLSNNLMCLKLQSPCVYDMPHAVSIKRNWLYYNEMEIDSLILIINYDDFENNLSIFWMTYEYSYICSVTL